MQQRNHKGKVSFLVFFNRICWWVPLSIWLCKTNIRMNDFWFNSDNVGATFDKQFLRIRLLSNFISKLSFCYFSFYVLVFFCFFFHCCHFFILSFFCLFFLFIFSFSLLFLFLDFVFFVLCFLFTFSFVLFLLFALFFRSSVFNLIRSFLYFFYISFPHYQLSFSIRQFTFQFLLF